MRHIGSHVPVLGLMFLAFFLIGFRLATVRTELPEPFARLLNQHVSLQGTIIDYPDVRETSTRLTVEVQREGSVIRIIAVVIGHAKFKVGDVVSVSGSFALPEPFETAGGRMFAYDTFLAKDGVFALVNPAHVEVIGRDRNPWLTIMRTLGVIRESFLRAMERAIPEPESALAAGLLVGGKQGLGQSLLDDFTTAGLIHIVVLSGYNVTIVAEAVLRILGFLPRRMALTIAGSTIGLFVLAAGAGAAAVRAGMMALLGLVARSTGRTYAVLRALLVTFLGMLIWNPLLLMRDPGFQFSFAATLGLILLAESAERLLGWIRVAAIREIAASTLAAQIGVLPILLFQTGNLSLVSFFVNIIVLPVIPLAMGLGTVATLTALVLPTFADPLVRVAGLPAYAVLAYVITIAHFAAVLPLAQVIVPAFPFWIVVVAYAGLGVLVWKLRTL